MEAAQGVSFTGVTFTDNRQSEIHVSVRAVVVSLPLMALLGLPYTASHTHRQNHDGNRGTTCWTQPALLEAVCGATPFLAIPELSYSTSPG